MKKMFFAALAATMMFASCNKEENGVNSGNGQEGAPATVGISFTLPASVDSRDSQGVTDGTSINATSTESDIKTVHVFVFNADGSVPTAGSVTSFLKADFDEPTTGNFELKEAKHIQTTSGSKRIYIAANLASAPAFSDEATFRAAIQNTGWNGSKWDAPATGFVMSSKAIAKTLIAQEENTTTNPANVVSASLERTIAKVVVTSNVTNNRFVQDFTSITNPDGSSVALKLNYIVYSWAPGYVANNFYVTQNINTSTSVLSTPNGNRTGHVAQGSEFVYNVAGVTSSPSWGSYNSAYVGENRPDGMLYGQATYVMVRTEAKPSHKAVVNGAGEVEWILASGADFTSGFIFLKHENGDVFFCDNATDASAVAGKLEGGNVRSKQWEYPNCMVYYMVTLNLDKIPVNTHKAVVYRNQFINVNITGIAGDKFGGIPGTATSGGDDPVDPDDPGQTPDPEDPEEPITEENSYLLVKIESSPWVFSGTDVILE